MHHRGTNTFTIGAALHALACSTWIPETDPALKHLFYLDETTCKPAGDVPVDLYFPDFRE